MADSSHPSAPNAPIAGGSGSARAGAGRRGVLAVPALAATFASACLLAGPIVGSGSVHADVVTTTEGLVLDGTVERAADGAVTVTTREGTVQLAKERVRSIEAGRAPETTYGALLDSLAGDDLDGRFKLALRAEADGAPGAARRAYASIIAVDPEHAAARRALGFERSGAEWLPTNEARRRRGLVLFEGAWMLPAEVEIAARAATPAKVEADRGLADVLRAAVGPDLPLATAARERWSVAPAARRAATATALLRDRAPAVRAAACAELATAGDEAALRPLITSALADPDGAVRRAAVAAAATFGNDDTAVPFIKALSTSHPGLVASAAQAIAGLGDPRGIVYLVKRISSHGASPRVVVEFLTKTAYIRDYDVEIAQAANIANPVVGTAVEGVVFDTKVLDLAMERTVVETILIESFNRLAGAHATDVAGVLAWAKANAAQMRGFPPEPSTQRAGASRPVSATTR
jgi:hypothetical protein